MGLLFVVTLPAGAADVDPVVVADHGGASALPYYRALNLQPRAGKPTGPQSTLPVPSPSLIPPVSESAFLPVRSTRLSPGRVTARVIAAPGLQPFFLMGDDSISRAWLVDRRDTLLAMHAIGLVVNVQAMGALDELRRMAGGLTLVPTPADDLAQRLRLTHYPLLITATAIEQ